MMSSVIGGAMLPHAPQFFTMPETEDRNTVERVKTAAAEIGTRLRALRPSLRVLRRPSRSSRGSRHRVVNRSRRARLGEAAERAGIEAVFHAVERLDRPHAAERVAHAQPGQSARLRHRLHDQQVRMIGDEWNRALATEIDIGLVTAGNLANVVLDVSRPRSIKIQFECELVHTSPSRVGFLIFVALSIPDSVHC
jgi:hypothetical protein